MSDKGKITPVVYQEIFKEQMYFNLESRRKSYLNNFKIPKMYSKRIELNCSPFLL